MTQRLMQRRRGRRERGFALAMCLVLVMVLALAMVGACRLSLQRTVTALEAQRLLQRRWGTTSCQYALAGRGESILAFREEQLHRSLAQCSSELALGSQRFELVFCDEQAKANVNALVEPSARLPEALRRLQSLLGSSPMARRLRLRPLAEGASPASGEAAWRFRSLGQVFDPAPPQDLLGDAAAQRLTCWGNGTVNVRRADASVLRHVLEPVWDESRLRRLLVLRQERMPLAAMLDQLDLSFAQRSWAEAHLCDTSRCHGLWIVCHEGARSHYRLVVQTSGDAAGREPVVIQW